MRDLLIAASLGIAALLVVAALQTPTDGATVIERQIAIESPSVVERAMPDLPPPAAPVPVLTPTPAADTSGGVDIGWEPPVDAICAMWFPERPEEC